MRISVLKERRAHEYRVAGSPESVKKFRDLGADVVVETGAGEASEIPDSAFEEEGAVIAESAKAALAGADIVLKVQRPMIGGEDEDELANLAPGQVLVCQMSALTEPKFVDALAQAGVTGFALELIPRISRAQAMDVLSSQSNLTGYRSVIEALYEYRRIFPLMMTAAGTLPPARVVIMGAGVAGLQAIATARRLGAIVSAFDVRAAAKEQVESLGASFVEVDPESDEEGEASNGYAREMSDDYKQRQSEALREHLKKQDIAITTALIPGRQAPVLISEEMVKEMKAGSVIVDIATEQGGNCELSEHAKVVHKHGVTIIGHANLASRVGEDASRQLAKNILNFLTPMIDEESISLKIDLDDEVVAGTLVTRDGEIMNEAVAEAARTSATEQSGSKGRKKGD
jgi:NAD(P) transhydrogenase subunit alpha